MKSIFNNIIALTIFAGALSSSTELRANSADSLRIQELLQERAEVLRNNGKTKTIDQELFNLGYLPVAIVSKTSDDLNIIMEFPLYKNIRKENEDRFIARVRSLYPQIEELNIDQEQELVKVNFTNNITEEEINSFLKIFGYQGFEIR